MQNFRHIAQNAGHTVQNDGPTMQNVGRTTHNVSRNTLNVCQGPKGGLDGLGSQQPPIPLNLKKLLCLEMMFRKLGTKENKNIKSDN